MSQEELEEQLVLLTANSSLQQIQEYINQMTKVRGFDQETPIEAMLFLNEEVGELTKEIRIFTNLRLDTAKANEDHLKEEIADVFTCLLNVCKITNVDLFQAFKQKEEINSKRIWK